MTLDDDKTVDNQRAIVLTISAKLAATKAGTPHRFMLFHACDARHDRRTQKMTER